jgi:hypothetical protein
MLHVMSHCGLFVLGCRSLISFHIKSLRIPFHFTSSFRFCLFYSIASLLLFRLFSRSKYPILRCLELDVRGTSKVQLTPNGSKQLSLEVGEIKSHDPSTASLTKAATQLLQRMYLVAYVSHFGGCSDSGICTGRLFTSFASQEDRWRAMAALRKAPRPWKDDSLLKDYVFDVRIG